MISRGRINLFYSRDETMNFFCLANAARKFVRFGAVFCCLLLPSKIHPQPPTLHEIRAFSCEENWFEINARICYRKNNKLAFELVEKKLLRVNKPTIWIDIV